MKAVTNAGLEPVRPAKDLSENFETLTRAFKNGDVALMECQLVSTGEKVAAIVMVNRNWGPVKADPKAPRGKRRFQEVEEFEFVPVAVMLYGNPYTLVNPPKADEGDGFVSQEEAWTDPVIPADFPVQPLKPGDKADDPAT